MPKPTFLLVAALAFPLSASAYDAQTFVSGEMLRGWCENNRDAAAIYVMGFNDATERTKQRIVDASRRWPERSSQNEELRFYAMGSFCLPGKLSVTHATEVACNWLESNPAKVSQPAAALLPQAYRKEFPCLAE
ncbi:Rap1a/Tai family immunity protein [Rhizobium sp. RAF56]|jgi:hypothetical protein|uniref:Rap1a/Tai family immunity protein n=1 Tax=Rhizobium sp. RAF56 TaxID=3233062 RepID=UPI003F998394